MRFAREPEHLGLAVVLFSGVALALFLGAPAVQNIFTPPRTAVVDISNVFDNYDKVKDRQAQLNTKLSAVRDRLKELETSYKDLQAELQVVQKGTDLYAEKRLELKKLELEVETLRDTEGKALKDTMRDFLEEIRREITREITAFAKARDLDLVVEKTVTAESGGGAVGFRWPIVHYARPQIDITEEIAKLLNERYRKR
jgi:Skp family chaperone for outer membrane proteins